MGAVMAEATVACHAKHHVRRALEAMVVQLQPLASTSTPEAAQPSGKMQ